MAHERPLPRQHLPLAAYPATPRTGTEYVRLPMLHGAQYARLSVVDGTGAEAAVAPFAGKDRRGISLRLGSLYGPESPATHEQLDYARKGPGRGDAYLPQISVLDGARAIVAALMQPIPSGIYDVVDDEPLTRGEVFAAMAQAVGRKRLWQPPAQLMRMMAGVVYDMMSRSLRVSNRRFKEVSGWQPLVANARVGWARIIEESRATTSIPTY